jgi:tetratricopeptide (TPR) repeat protein
VPSKALICCSIALLLAAPARLFGQDSLAAARQLYAAAEYHNALAMLSALLAANPSPQERQSIELYRVFCLFAINSVEDANSALDAMILRDPLFRPGADVVPRRLRTAFTDARKRLLPKIVEEKYLVAKSAFDQGDYKSAAVGFTQALMALSDPDIATEAEERPLSDLKVLATGFHELAIRAMAPPAAAPMEPPAPAPAPAPAAPSEPKIYQAGDAGVTPPAVIRQDMPAFPLKIVTAKTGQLELIIDETGAVESATIVQSLDPRYNLLVLGAAKFWRYRPATVDGAPVKFRKRIQMTVAPER